MSNDMAKMIISTTAWPRSPVVSWLFLFLFFVPSTQTAAGGGKLFFSSIRRYTGISISAYAFYPHRSTFDKRLAAGFRRHLTLGKLSGDVKSKFTVQDGSRIIASCLVGLDGPGGHQNWAKLSTPNRTQQTQLFPLKKKKLISQSP
ncbi:hypothetical protein T01_15837 [Trichinella spiralis]|uniref:Uncharacterized protein n=1 Tax=Trichinella spiralis TaxID=6334 RepID=A0A0V1BMI5_TRISP|nr:hypothetical protein T01_15837 [Trichinella spiralis]